MSLIGQVYSGFVTISPWKKKEKKEREEEKSIIMFMDMHNIFPILVDHKYSGGYLKPMFFSMLETWTIIS